MSRELNESSIVAAVARLGQRLARLSERNLAALDALSKYLHQAFIGEN